MRTIAPDYYDNFVCIAGDCTHSCCIGWEIDVDDNTFNYYKSVGGEFGKRLKKSIKCSGNTQYFELSKEESCPFLNVNNLCDIIIELGEDKLCRICADHPRYRNFFSDRTEIGLGLCCEAAAELIVNGERITKLIEIENDGNNCPINLEEKRFFELRKRLFDIVQNRKKTVSERVCQLLRVCDIKLEKKTPREWAEIYMSLEHLDKAWTERLNALSDFTGDLRIKETRAEQLLIYFLYRHMPDGLYDGRLKQRIAFAVHAVYIICLLSSTDNITETARMYSAEIEYSEENMNRLLEMM